jgi:DNA-3-methyladenine glycosylase
MLNVASGAPGQGTAVLLRAVMPLEGLELMATRRGGVREIDLARGPGRLAQAFAIGPEHDGLDLCAGGPLHLTRGREVLDSEIGQSARIGITRDADRLLRFYIRGNRSVSGPRWLSP